MRLVICVAVFATMTMSCQREPPVTDERFRRLTSTDFCSGAEVFANPTRQSLIGVLVGQSTIIDHRGKVVKGAVNMKSVIDRRVAALWRTEDETLSLYVSSHDAALANCRWFVDTNNYYRLAESDVDPHVRLRLTRRGWETIR